MLKYAHKMYKKLKIMTKLKYYCQLTRINKPIGVLLLLWPTLWALFIASNGKPNIILIIVFTVGVFLMRSGTVAINDYADVDFDRDVERTKNRVLVHGLISKKNAVLLGVMLSIIAFIMALVFLKITTILMCIPAFIIAMTYPLMKRFFIFPQLYLGVAYSFGILMAFVEIQNNIPLVGWILFIANIIWTFGYDTIYALVDKPDDMNSDMYTSAKTLGQYVLYAIVLSYLIFIALMITVGIIEEFNYLYYIGIGIATIMLSYQIWQIRGEDRNICFKMFLLNNRVGMIVFIGILANYVLR